MILDYFELNLSTGDVDEMLNDLDLRESIPNSHERNLQDLIASMADAKHRDYFSAEGKEYTRIGELNLYAL